jgi:hypothetical protein
VKVIVTDILFGSSLDEDMHACSISTGAHVDVVR